jgi:hypothetical protein
MTSEEVERFRERYGREPTEAELVVDDHCAAPAAPKEREMKLLRVETKFYPTNSPVVPSLPITFVLVEGEAGDYAAYAGCGDAKDVEWIASHGDKISFEEACALFGELDRELYRD